MSATSVTMDRLRQETRDLHDAAEGREFQRRMVRGGLSRDAYAAWLEQMYLVHSALEKRLADRLEDDARFAAVTPRQFQVPRLLADLESLDRDPEDIRPLPATGKLLDTVAGAAASEPLRLLGYHYVLEGSNNGNRFIARALLPALGLERDGGGRYLDPYGPEQPAVWGDFKRAMSTIPFSTEEVDTLVAAAREMFGAIADLSDQLDSARRTETVA